MRWLEAAKYEVGQGRQRRAERGGSWQKRREGVEVEVELGNGKGRGREEQKGH